MATGAGFQVGGVAGESILPDILGLVAVLEAGIDLTAEENGGGRKIVPVDEGVLVAGLDRRGDLHAGGASLVAGHADVAGIAQGLGGTGGEGHRVEGGEGAPVIPQCVVVGPESGIVPLAVTATAVDDQLRIAHRIGGDGAGDLAVDGEIAEAGGAVTFGAGGRNFSISVPVVERQAGKIGMAALQPFVDIRIGADGRIDLPRLIQRKLRCVIGLRRLQFLVGEGVVTLVAGVGNAGRR